MTAGFVARVWRCHSTVMAVRSGHDPPYPIHTALMTGCAAPCHHHPAMDHPRPAEGRRGLVARLAGACSREVGRRFAQRRCTVMTAHATRHDPGVIKRGPHKRRGGLVTTLAGRRGRNVGRRLAYDSGISAAMTGRTTGRDPRVIHRGARPEGRRRFVARLAPERGWEVGRRFAHNPRSSAAMTGRATRRDPRVTKHGPHKRRRGLVTTLARRRGRDVAR